MAGKNIADAIRKRLARDPDLAEGVENALFGFNVSEEIFRIRTALGLTQTELALKMGTKQSVVARLESADYVGHSLKLLRRVAEATGKRLEVRFVDTDCKDKSGTTVQIPPLCMYAPNSPVPLFGTPASDTQFLEAGWQDG